MPRPPAGVAAIIPAPPSEGVPKLPGQVMRLNFALAPRLLPAPRLWYVEHDKHSIPIDIPLTDC